MRQVFVDTSVLLHAIGRPHADRAASVAVVAAQEDGLVSLNIAAETVQEFLFHRMRSTTREGAVADTQSLLSACRVHVMDEEVIGVALTLAGTTQIRGRDAFIAATAVVGGFSALITTDARFVAVPGLAVVHPADLDL